MSGNLEGLKVAGLSCLHLPLSLLSFYTLLLWAQSYWILSFLLYSSSRIWPIFTWSPLNRWQGWSLNELVEVGLVGSHELWRCIQSSHSETRASIQLNFVVLVFKASHVKIDSAIAFFWPPDCAITLHCVIYSFSCLDWLFHKKITSLPLLWVVAAFGDVIHGWNEAAKKLKEVFFWTRFWNAILVKKGEISNFIKDISSVTDCG